MTEPTVGWLADLLQSPLPPFERETPLGPISIDSRTLHAGATFWAIRGQRDGHEFVQAAFDKRAKLAVVDRTWASSSGTNSSRLNLILAQDTRQALLLAGRAWRSQFAFPVVGITGTNGKTSTKDLILRLLSLRYRVAGTKGNLNNDLGVPLTLLDISSDSDYAVIEMGANHPGEIAHLCEIASPTHGLVTSIGKAHLEGFGTMEALARTKKELYDSVADSGTAFVPTDDELCVAAASSVTEKLGYGFNAVPGHWNGAFVHGENLRFDTTGAACFTVGGTDICLGTPGRPAAMAALAALTIARHFDIDPSVCQDTISAWRGGSGRVSIMRMGGMTVIDDTYNANPPSMRAALETLSHLSAARHVAILGDMYELGSYSEAEHERLGQSIGTYDVDHAIFVGTLSAMAAESARNSGVLTSYFPDYESLESELSKLLKSGDAILVKASRGMKLERVIDYIRNTTA